VGQEVLNRAAKNGRIKATLRETRARRQTQICRSYEVKVDKSHTSTKTQECLRRLFLEAKWFYNNMLARGDVWNANYKTTIVLVKKGGSMEPRELQILSSQMRQEIIGRAKDNIKGLSVLKSKGHRVGALKFVGRIRSIPLNQYGVTYRILNSGCISIQNLEQPLKVRGLNQIPKGAEYSSALLIQRNGDYYLHMATWQQPERKALALPKVGMDLGIDRQITFSNGVAVKFEVLMTKKIRRLHRELSKRKQHGRNWFKTKLKLNREYGKSVNEKRDIRNKIVSKIVGTYDTVCFQNDNVAGWQRMWGRRIQATAIGGITSAFKQKARTPSEVERFFASTKKCSGCGNVNCEMPLSERVYRCEACGLVIDRDLNAAINIRNEGVPAERREVTPVDTKTSTEFLEYFNSIPRVHASLVEEAGSPRLSVVR